MLCATCESDNPEGARFCASCGSRLASTCPSCDAELPPRARFCASCGTPVGGAIPAPIDAPAEAPATAERRRVSVMFVDLENFTPLAESMDPEEVRAVQSRYFDVARSVVASYGGTIEKFIGDAVMAVWGAPTAHEDDAERAVRAALALVDAVGRLGGPASGRSLRARGAVATGEAAVTVGALGQGMVAGDLVNVAARLQSRAPRAGVLVDTATRDLAPQAAAFEAVGSLSLKGRSGRLEAYRADPSDAATPGRPAGRHTGAFVGRERELRELTDLLTAVTRDRRSRLVSIVGIAGIGKSRLVEELYAYIDQLPQEVAWHAGRAPAYGAEVAYAAVAEMVRRRLRIEEGMAPELARRQLSTALAVFVRDEDERGWIEPRLAVLLDREGADGFDRDELFAAWRRFFERVSDLTPAVLVFEDIHWADPGLLEFIEHLATWTRAHPILLITLARPELLDHRPGWGVGLGSFTALHLERLPDDAMRELLLGRAANLPSELVGRILEHSGGVPLYAVEVARILDGADAARAIEIPDSLHGLIAARIDALPASERRLLLAAAVLGHRFRPEALLSVAGADVEDARERIEALVRRELLAVDEDLNSPRRGELSFVQELIRELAYRTLSRSDRRALHLAAARYLESREDEGSAEPLAGHLVAAHALTTDQREAGRLARRAVSALRAAARDANRLHLPQRALAHLDVALRLADGAEQTIALLDEAADTARAAGELDVSERHLRRLMQLHESARDRSSAARARARLASVLLSGQRNEPALAELESAMRAVRHLETDPSRVELAAQLARARLVILDSRGALEWAERALAAAQTLGLTNVATDVLITRGTARHALGEEEAGLADLRTAIAQAAEAGSLHTELRARNNLAWLLVADDPRTTMEIARQGFELASTMGLGDVAVQLADVACTTAIDTGEWAWALATIDELTEHGMADEYRIVLASSAAIIHALQGDDAPMRGLDAFEPIPPDTDAQVLAGVHQARGWAAFVAGRFDEARSQGEASVAGYGGADPVYQRTLIARASLWQGDREAAAAAIDALEGVDQRGRATAATTTTLRAGLAALEGDPDVRGRYRAAAEAWRSLDLPLHLCLCLVDERHLSADPGADEAELIGLLRSLGANGLERLLAPEDARHMRRPAERSGRPSAT
ncbi:MAG TPA: AAA family ATPase [Candidatus Limnocylindria bacterium]|nr:AAA family ATPase [Candidatus Limnocylindria bacterium]